MPIVAFLFGPGTIGPGRKTLKRWDAVETLVVAVLVFAVYLWGHDRAKKRRFSRGVESYHHYESVSTGDVGYRWWFHFSTMTVDWQRFDHHDEEGNQEATFQIRRSDRGRWQLRDREQIAGKWQSVADDIQPELENAYQLFLRHYRGE